MTDPDYRADGYVHLRQFIPREVCMAVLARLKIDLSRQGISLASIEKEGPLLRAKAPELYGYHYPMFTSFLWGMTPAVEQLVGEPLLPTYSYFRLYRQGDICRVHGDRPSCEHSISLTLAYSDDVPWALEVAKSPAGKLYNRADEDFAVDELRSAVAMEAGDAVLYQGVAHHHGRTTPNPNRWSAHLFLHWVARDGPYAEHAFDGQPPPQTVELGNF
jgi:hypothetical protein